MKAIQSGILFLTAFFSLTAVAGEPAKNSAAAPARETATRFQAHQIDDPSQDVADSDLPTVSKFQTPGTLPHIGCGGDPTSGEPCIDDGGGGGSATGACNCSRICWDGNVICHLASSGIGCAAGVEGSLCKSCWNKCY